MVKRTIEEVEAYFAQRNIKLDKALSVAKSDGEKRLLLAAAFTELGESIEHTLAEYAGEAT